MLLQRKMQVAIVLNHLLSRRHRRKIDIRLHEAPGDRELLDRVLDGELDLSFVTLPAREEKAPLGSLPPSNQPMLLAIGDRHHGG